MSEVPVYIAPPTPRCRVCQSNYAIRSDPSGRCTPCIRLHRMRVLRELDEEVQRAVEALAPGQGITLRLFGRERRCEVVCTRDPLLSFRARDAEIRVRYWRADGTTAEARVKAIRLVRPAKKRTPTFEGLER